MNMWQPIETVPAEAKEACTPLLLFCPGESESECVVGHWVGTGWMACVDWVPLEPTHWMPLPDAPAPIPEDQEDLRHG